MTTSEDRMAKHRKQMELGKAVREQMTEMKAEGLSNSEIAKRIGMPENFVRKYMPGKTNVEE